MVSKKELAKPCEKIRCLDCPGIIFLAISLVGAMIGQGNAAIKGAGDVHVPFIENCGQMEDKVAYYAPTFNGTVFVAKDGKIIYKLPGGNGPEGVALKETIALISANCMSAENPVKTVVNYFIGNDPSNWRTGLPAYRRVNLGSAAPGITVKLQAAGNRVEKLFFLQPGADPADIKMRLEGARQIHINAEGQLEAETDLGSVIFSKPVAFQYENGRKIDVSVAYAIHNDTYGFVLGPYDSTRRLVIDPILASTFLGGSDSDGGVITLDSNDNVYVYGRTTSSDFPTTVGAYDAGLAGDSDLFVAKLDETLSTLSAATYLGGTGDEYGGTIDLDDSGNVYIGGLSLSSDFPITAPPTMTSYDETSNGMADIVVAKLSSDLTQLIASTYLGGSGNEGYGSNGTRLMLDSNGNVFVANTTHGSGGSCDYPVTDGAYDESYNDTNTEDIVISKLDGNLTTLSASTFLGGSLWDVPYAFTLDSSDNVLVSGRTSSNNFPCSASAYQTSRASTVFGGYDFFVSKLDKDLSSLLASTYLGGTGQDVARSICAGSDGTVYVSGYTENSSFPTVTGAWDTVFGGTNEGVVSKLNSDFTDLLASTFVGGSGNDYVYSLVEDDTGTLHAAIGTSSSDFETTDDAIYSAYQGGDSDGVYLRLGGDLARLKYSTFLGGSDTDRAACACLSSRDDIYVSGSTSSSDFPTSIGAYDTDYNGDGDSFIATFDLYTVTANATGPGTGNVSSDIGGIDYTYPAENTGITTVIENGVGVVVTASADTGCTTSWNGTCSSAGGTEAGNDTDEATCTFDTVSEDKTVSVEFSSSADLSITKDDGAVTEIPGTGISYTIVVTNNGPCNVAGAVVTDTFPAELTDIDWTCAASSGSSCTASGSDDINDTVDLLVNGTASYTAEATIDSSASGTLSNTATVDVPAGVTEINGDDNSATDIDNLAEKPGIAGQDADPDETSATLEASISPNHAQTDAFFEWGAKSTYSDSTTPEDVGATTGQVQFSKAISGLVSNTVYHFRCTAQNAAGTSYGTDRTFKTGTAGLSCHEHYPAKIADVEYADIKMACEAAIDEDTVLIWAGIHTGNLDVILDASTDVVALNGGWNCDFSSRTDGETAFDGIVTIMMGSVVIDSISIR